MPMWHVTHTCPVPHTNKPQKAMMTQRDFSFGRFLTSPSSEKPTAYLILGMDDVIKYTVPS